jgi:hypothetical protein
MQGRPGLESLTVVLSCRVDSLVLTLGTGTTGLTGMHGHVAKTDRRCSWRSVSLTISAFQDNPRPAGRP